MTMYETKSTRIFIVILGSHTTPESYVPRQQCQLNHCQTRLPFSLAGETPKIAQLISYLSCDPLSLAYPTIFVGFFNHFPIQA